MAAPDDIANAFISELNAQAESHDVAFVNGHVRWRRFGDGPPLVLLHGGHGSWLHWARNIGAWSASRTVWVPDLPGYGDSDTPAAPTLGSLVDATCSTLNEMIGADVPIALAGFSFGGLVAAHVAAQRGAVAKLALIGAAGHGGVRRPRGALRSWREAADRHDDAALADVMRHNLAMHMLHDAAAIDALALRIHTEACRRTRFRSKSISLKGGLPAVLDPYRAPLLLAWGRHDVTATPDQVLPMLSQGRSSCRTRIVDGAGHWVQYERADALNSLLLEWLQEPNTMETT